MRLGVNTVLFGGQSMATAFRWAAACGYDAVELCAVDGLAEHLIIARWREAVDVARRLAAEHGLAITAIEQTSHEPAVMAATLQAAEALGCGIVNTGSQGPGNVDAAFDVSARVLRSFAERAADHGVSVCVKAHVGFSVCDTATSLRIIEAVDHPAFGLDLDPSHLHRAGECAAEAARASLEHVRHVHVRDCQGRQVDPGPPHLQANGRGQIDLLGLFAVLAERGYAGPVNLEVCGARDYELAMCVMIAAEAIGHMRGCVAASRAGSG